MTILGITLPVGITWETIVTVTLAIIAFITALLKLKASNNQIGIRISSLITILTDFASSLSKVANLVDTVNTVSDQNKTLITNLTSILTEQRENNKNTAKFISECFQESNLSDEKKLRLKVLLDELFYGNNMAIIDELKTAKLETDKQLLQANETISTISKDLAKTKEKLTAVQATTKTSRRIR